MIIKVHQFEHIVKKLSLVTRNAADRLAWFYHEGRPLTRTKRSHGRGDLPGEQIRQQLKLNQNQFRRLVGCHLDREEYLSILREKGLA